MVSRRGRPGSVANSPRVFGFQSRSAESADAAAFRVVPRAPLQSERLVLLRERDVNKSRSRRTSVAYFDLRRRVQVLASYHNFRASWAVPLLAVSSSLG